MEPFFTNVLASKPINQKGEIKGGTGSHRKERAEAGASWEGIWEISPIYKSLSYERQQLLQGRSQWWTKN